MKHMRTTSLLLCLPLSFALHAQISNGGFESVIIAEDTTATDWAVMSEFGAGVVPGGHTGDFAFNVWNWYWYGLGLASNGASAWLGEDGMPLIGHPTQLTGWFRRDRGFLQSGPGDSSVVGVLITHWNAGTAQRDTVAQGSRLFDDQLEWAPFAIDINYLSAEEGDTLIVQLASSVNGFCDVGSTGTCAYFYVDDLSLTFAQGLTEGLMEEGAVRLVPQADGAVRVLVQEHVALPVRVQLWDGFGRDMGERVVRSRNELVVLRQAAGFVAFRAFSDEMIIGGGSFVLQR